MLLIATFFFLISNSFAVDFLVDIHAFAPDILVEARYSDEWNFVGSKVEGYHKSRCLLTREAVKALSQAQREFEKQGLSLLLFDCYRPQRAVNFFVQWTRDPKDQKMKAFFYPGVPKDSLLDGYIAARSGHSRGSTVDLTLVNLAKAKSRVSFLEKVKDCRVSASVTETGQLDMGTTFDCFSELSHTGNKQISKRAQKNRQLLKKILERQGFKNYSKEWWHFSLENEPFPNTYFDVDVK